MNTCLATFPVPLLRWTLALAVMLESCQFVFPPWPLIPLPRRECALAPGALGARKLSQPLHSLSHSRCAPAAIYGL